jgi:PncC family amidohydrolase
MNDESNRLLSLLLARGWRVSTAESCTGGMIASRIVGVPGASAVFLGGAVTYAPELKTALLGVRARTIEECGVVSREVAREMAEGCRARFGTELAISVTGLAGPGGGTEDVPVGRVFIGIAGPGETRVIRETFSGDRETVREEATLAAIRHALAFLEQDVSC